METEAQSIFVTYLMPRFQEVAIALINVRWQVFAEEFLLSRDVEGRLGGSVG